MCYVCVGLCCHGSRLASKHEIGVAIRPGRAAPILSMSTDQGSICWSAAWFMTFKLRVHLWLWPDPNHGVWNDAMNAVSACGGLSHLHLMTFGMNFHLGPWQGNAFYQKLVEGVQEFKAIASPQDPLFRFFLPKILADTNESYRATEPNIASDIFSSLQDRPVFTKKGQRVATSRWFQFVTESKHFDADWHARCGLPRPGWASPCHRVLSTVPCCGLLSRMWLEFLAISHDIVLAEPMLVV